MRIGLSPRGASRLIARILVGALAAAAPVAAQAAPQDRYYERSFVLAANQRCGLFQPQVSAALNAAAWQARGAALRAGANERELSETARRARARAASTPCDSGDLKLVGGRVQHAFAGWSRTARMTFPGDRSDWVANRGAYARPTWRLMQQSSVGASPVRLGVVGGMDRADVMTAVVSWHGRPRPTGARIVLRDAAVAPQPWLARDLPPEVQRKAVWASSVVAAETGLLPEGREAGQAWRFPAAAADAIGRLDPREAVAVEFVFRDGSVARSVFEAGDFAAGRAFLAMGPV
ncbi:MAG: hypothetical protein DI552_07925 [Brevundimonas sp.]|uniref:SCP domain-containing protein n=1 Tax=Brevundimonas albigilva TaxID=1312364 RepID=A0ABY4SLG6_9CAUL|nr:MULTISPECIES: hypothetical protein [Brevundimonas]PZU57500.1 MAG: hypothetical protein DI552_07925 [Brevundimonas sp.]UQV19304.1 hypothetical protein MU852_05755 [Brevundimonas albigilva]URI15777.1 hypothetical protein M8231_01920 [Brevundimonas albigilva]